MTQPRDINLAEWLDGVGFHPADTEAKQIGHEAARNLIAQLGGVLHWLLPAGRDKSLTFTALEDVLMRANRALAIEGGPVSGDLGQLAHLASLSLVDGLRAPEDARIGQYKAEQRGEAGGTTSASGHFAPGVAEASIAALQQVADEQGFELPGQEKTTYRATVRSAHGDVVTEVVGGKDYIQLATLATSAEQVRTAIQGPALEAFRGMYATIGDLQELSALIRVLAEAGIHVWDDGYTVNIAPDPGLAAEVTHP